MTVKVDQGYWRDGTAQ